MNQINTPGNADTQKPIEKPSSMGQSLFALVRPKGAVAAALFGIAAIGSPAVAQQKDRDLGGMAMDAIPEAETSNGGVQATVSRPAAPTTPVVETPMPEIRILPSGTVESERDFSAMAVDELPPAETQTLEPLATAVVELDRARLGHAEQMPGIFAAIEKAALGAKGMRDGQTMLPEDIEKAKADLEAATPDIQALRASYKSAWENAKSVHADLDKAKKFALGTTWEALAAVIGPEIEFLDKLFTFTVDGPTEMEIAMQVQLQKTVDDVRSGARNLADIDKTPAQQAREALKANQFIGKFPFAGDIKSRNSWMDDMCEKSGNTGAFVYMGENGWEIRNAASDCGASIDTTNYAPLQERLYKGIVTLKDGEKYTLKVYMPTSANFLVPGQSVNLKLSVSSSKTLSAEWDHRTTPEDSYLVASMTDSGELDFTIMGLNDMIEPIIERIPGEFTAFNKQEIQPGDISMFGVQN